MSAALDVELPANPWWLRRPDLLTTGAVAVSLVALIIEVIRIGIDAAGVVTIVGVIVTGVGVFLARRSWWSGVILTVVGCAVTASMGWNPITSWTVVVFTLFAATVRGAPPLWGILIAALPLFTIVAFEARSGPVSPDALAAVAATIAGGAAGAAIRSQHQYWSALREHALEALATRDAEARRRVEQERLRIARDLHDVVGHQVAVASMHLGAVEVTVRSAPEDAAAAAARAREALRSVTAETQQILELLRTPDAAPTDHAVAGVASLDALIDSFERIGLNVTATLPQTWPATQPGVEVTIYRIVQEALTNAHRYGTGTATVTITATDHRAEITISNPVGRDSRAHAGSGFGLIGMRERVAAAGGQLVLDETSRDEFSVFAVLALDGRRLS